MIVLNDLHIAVQRGGGTTLLSAAQLRDWLRERLASFLSTTCDSIVINGDLFDKFEVDANEVVKLYELFADWLKDTGDATLTLIQGNHDWNPRGGKLSSFHLLCHFLRSHFGDRIQVADSGFQHVEGDVWCIPHMPNQDLFALEVEKACAEKHYEQYLLLHCNVKNTFAEHSDHSLNLTSELLDKLILAGWTLVVGHEHQGYTLRGGRVIVVGNQWPSSVADCIGDDNKKALKITEHSCFTIPTWDAAGSYAEIDWRELSENEAKFIRVTGDATSEQAADVISTIAKYRQSSDAFVITNAVRIDGAVAMEEMAADSIENIKAFDVTQAILEHLDERQQKVVKELMQ